MQPKEKKEELRAANKDFYLLTPPPWVQVGLSINKHASAARKGVRVFYDYSTDKMS